MKPKWRKVLAVLLSATLLFSSYSPFIQLALAQVAEPPSETPVATDWEVDSTGLNAVTTNVVEVGKVYVAPFNELLKITFTEITGVAGKITLKQISLTPEEQAAVGAVSDVGYEVTSTMENGTFKYDMTLPVVGGVTEATGVKYAESVDTLSSAVEISNAVAETNEITIVGLTHFTVFVVTNTVPASTSGLCVSDATNPATGCYNTIQAAIDAATAGDTILIEDGTYVLPATLQVNKSVTLEGESEAGVIINATSNGTGYGIRVSANDVTLKNFTILPPVVPAKLGTSQGGGYGIHVSNTPGLVTNLNLEEITIENGNRTGFDLHGVDVGYLKNLTSRNAAYGNGLSLSGCSNITVEGFVSSGNVWGGIALYNSTILEPDRATHDITLLGATFSQTESNPLYVQNEFGLTITGVDAQGFEYLVRNPDFRSGAPDYIFYQTSLANAQAFALAIHAAPIPNTSSTISNKGGNHFYVFNGMVIQRAINAVSNGGTVEVHAGDYQEQIVVNKDLELLGFDAPHIFSVATPTVYKITENASSFQPVVLVYGGTLAGGVISGAEKVTVTLDGFNIDGNDRSSGSYRATGVFARNAVMTISNNTVHNMHVNGSETFGILVYGDSNVQILGNSITQYARGGIGIAGDNGAAADPVANVVNNIVSGPGVDALVTWAPNGIQFGYGATGTIDGNTVTGNGWPGSDWAGTGILIVDTHDVIVENNMVSNNEQAIGIVDFPEVLYGATWSGIVSNVQVLDNTVTSNSWGLSIANDVSNVVVTGNTFSEIGGDGIDVYTYADTVTPPSGVMIEFNRIEDIDLDGLWVGDTVVNQVLADKNWWGDITGPSGDASGLGESVVGNALYCPWLANSDIDNPVYTGDCLPVPAAPEMLGFNVEGISTLTTVPPTIACGGYTDGSAQQSAIWSDVSASADIVKYIRHNQRPGGVNDIILGQTDRVILSSSTDSDNLSVLGTLADDYDNFYAGWGSFGAGEGLYKTRVRAYSDANSNGHYDVGEPISEWSEFCDVTFDQTPPVAPEIVFPSAEQYFSTTPILNDWTDVSDLSGVSYYRIEYAYDDGHTFSGFPYRTTTASERYHSPALFEEGGVSFRVQAFDNSGNEGAWSEWRHYYYDHTAPAVTVTSHADGGAKVNGVINVAGEVSDSYLSHYWFVVTDSVGAQVAGPGVVYDNGPLTSPSFSWDTSAVADGLYTIKLEARDKAGNKEPNASADPEVIGDSVDWVVIEVDNLGSVTGMVFNDPNANHVLDVAERDSIYLLSGWTVHLYDAGWNLLQTEVTGTDGSLYPWQYKFENLPHGTYYLCEELQSGWTQTYPYPGSGVESWNAGLGTYCRRLDTTNEPIGFDYSNIPFGNVQSSVLGSVTGMVFNDTNSNHVLDVAERNSAYLLSGWTVYLYDANWNLLQSEVTGSDSSLYPWQYKFENLPQATYYICEGMQPGWAQTYPYAGSGVETWNSVLGTYCRRLATTNEPAGFNYSNIPFGNATAGVLGSVTGMVFKDPNANHVLDASERNSVNLLNGWTVYLYDTSWNLLQSEVTGTDTTLMQGQYKFENLPQATYYVCERKQSGWTQTYPYSGSGVETWNSVLGTYCRRLATTNEPAGFNYSNIPFGNV